MTTGERLEKLEQELARVKRRNRLLLAVGAVAVGVCVLAWSISGTASKAQAQGAARARKVIRANEFVLEDDKGKTRAMLSVNENGPVLGMFDEKGKIRAALVVKENEPMMKMVDPNGKVTWTAP